MPVVLYYILGAVVSLGAVAQTDGGRALLNKLGAGFMDWVSNLGKDQAEMPGWQKSANKLAKFLGLKEPFDARTAEEEAARNNKLAMSRQEVAHYAENLKAAGLVAGGANTAIRGTGDLLSSPVVKEAGAAVKLAKTAEDAAAKLKQAEENLAKARRGISSGNVPAKEIAKFEKAVTDAKTALTEAENTAKAAAAPADAAAKIAKNAEDAAAKLKQAEETLAKARRGISSGKVSAKEITKFEKAVVDAKTALTEAEAAAAASTKATTRLGAWINEVFGATKAKLPQLPSVPMPAWVSSTAAPIGEAITKYAGPVGVASIVLGDGAVAAGLAAGGQGKSAAMQTLATVAEAGSMAGATATFAAGVFGVASGALTLPLIAGGTAIHEALYWADYARTGGQTGMTHSAAVSAGKALGEMSAARSVQEQKDTWLQEDAQRAVKAREWMKTLTDEQKALVEALLKHARENGLKSIDTLAAIEVAEKQNWQANRPVETSQNRSPAAGDDSKDMALVKMKLAKELLEAGARKDEDGKPDFTAYETLQALQSLITKKQAEAEESLEQNIPLQPRWFGTATDAQINAKVRVDIARKDLAIYGNVAKELDMKLKNNFYVKPPVTQQVSSGLNPMIKQLQMQRPGL